MDSKSNKSNEQHLAELQSLSHTALVEKILEQEKKLLELSNAEKHYYNLFKNAPVPILDIDYSRVAKHLTSHFKTTSEMVNYFQQHLDEATDLLNQRIVKEVNQSALNFFKATNFEQIRDNITKIYNPHGVTQIPESFVALLEGKHYFKLEIMISDFTNKLHTVMMRFSTDTPDFSRTFVSFEDITDIKRIQEELEARVRVRTHELEKANEELRIEIQNREQMAKDLHKSEARYRQLISIYPVGIFHTNKEGQNIYINSKACEIEGLKAAEARGYGWIKNLHPDDKERVIQTWENGVKYGNPINIDYRFIHDNKIIWVNGQTVPEYDEQGSIVGYVGILADITKQREAEEQIKQNQIEIAHFSRVNSMGEVASGIAHELNQPLTAIMSYASGVKRRLKDVEHDIPKGVIEAIDQTIRQAQRAGEVIHHLKDFLRKGALSKSETDINAAITDVLMFINKPINQENITIKLKLDKLLPTIYADKIHIEQVMMNIINNAIDAIVDGHCEKRLITISTAVHEKNFIRISISDTGPGIPANILDSIFSPFITTKKDGMGIGLSLCYNIVDKHGGKITVSTKLGAGTTFHITLPIK